MKKKTVGQYIKEYNVPDQMAMIRNNRLDPKICSDTCSDKLVVITGATSGIGHVTARKYASQGASLLCINRNLEKSQALKTEIEAEFGVPCDFRIVDLSILQEVRRLAEDVLTQRHHRVLSSSPLILRSPIHSAAPHRRELAERSLRRLATARATHLPIPLRVDKLSRVDEARTPGGVHATHPV